ncbi:VOC family protein [Acaryochloris marina]|uniref:VOC family protein n=1 Tax=Acaryochloris marina TaxID=155978 RepID=UPI001BB03800|nr:VOC family protein [Acaryochloris marina]QUY43695.1 VOC family protein [Acaryochloris marina S15]
MSSSPTLGPIHPLVPAGEDLEPAIAFYEQKLGFKVIHREGDPLRLAVVQRDMSVIYLCKNSYQNLGSPTSLRIQVNDIDQLFAEYEAKDESIVREKLAVKPWGPKEFVVYDPVGGCLTFFAMPGN